MTATAEHLIVEKYRSKFGQQTKPILSECGDVPTATRNVTIAVTPQNGGPLARFSRRTDKELWVDIVEDNDAHWLRRRVLFALAVPEDVTARYVADIERAVAAFNAALASAGKRSWVDRLLRRP